MKKKRGSKKLNVYANLASRQKAKHDVKKRRKAEYLATLPKHPLKRTLYRLHPKRFFKYWFSKEGLIMMLKIFAIGFGILVLLIAMLFLYYRRELDAIRPDEIAKRVQTTVTTYTDRNDIVLWEDKGDGNYKLTVKSDDDISKYMKDATVAIEDKDFYKHGGVSASGIMRAAWSNLTNKSTNVQGGSTLTQQLVKQVFFADEAGNRGMSGVPRKIKEVILAIQVEGIYKKNEILRLYLNESPYGGRRNGVESAAQTYFGKHAKDLTLAESALLAAIPQNPSTFNPYNPDGHKALIARQHTTLNYMVEQGYIEKSEAEEAKKVPILDTIKPEADQFAGIKAPHFVQMVKSELETKLGKKTVGDGGMTIKTTLDYRVQEIMEREMTDLFNSYKPASANFDNGAATMVDSQTGQVLGLVGSRGYDYPGYGAVNAATSWIQPGSSIKPFVYASLFKQREGTNWGAGSILADSPIPQSIYRTDDGKSVNNFDFKFRGNIPIRSGLAESRNIPAITAMYINERDNGNGDTLKTIQSLGDKSYCSRNDTVGLALAIGGCELKMIEHVNTFATIARMGVYKPVSSILEVRNSEGQIINQWKDDGKQVIDPQITFMLADILSDDAARAPSFGRGSSGLNVPGVKIAGKTGTSNLGNFSRDLWMNTFTPKATLSFWVGNHDSRPMTSALSTLVGPSAGNIMRDAHLGVFEKDGSWKSGDWFPQPAGIQRLTVGGRSDIYPSWYSKQTANVGDEKMTFDKVTKKRATDCTPESARIEINVSSTNNPLTNKKTYMASDGYLPNEQDDLHRCEDQMPFINTISVNESKNDIVIDVTQGTHALQTLNVNVGGNDLGSIAVTSSGKYTVSYPKTIKDDQTITVTLIDTALYSASPLTITAEF
ncbi:penicillin-binding protein [Candidatus Saccharibacteria bacterium]|nr:penicillin-binding protein [Candidatus Saccharibacteria bacterium]NCU40493.1 penicillin-binding protein [Candidatus Saccharibacteria bacterium]